MNAFRLTIILFCFLVLSSDIVYALPDPDDLTREMPGTDLYRVEIVKARSNGNAKRIAAWIHQQTQKPVYISPQDEHYLIEVGGFATLTEAESAVASFRKLGITGAAVVPGREYIQSADTRYEYGLRDKPVIQARDIDETILIDGKLSESAWTEVQPVGQFIQKEPFDKMPASEQTEIRVLRDDENIYFGIICHDSEPEKIIATEMRRDASLFNDDNIEIFLDTFYDRKNCYYFRTNPLGAKFDAIITEEGQNINADWNGLWYCKTDINEKGWTAEIAIPYHAIHYKEGLMQWGFNVGRDIRRKNEDTFWSYIPRSQGRSGKYKVSLFGDLKNPTGEKAGKKIEVIPYVRSGSVRKEDTDHSASEANGGLDLKYRLAGNMQADISFNTDFAQVEADQEIVNTTRFNIFFPEKRQFFLENTGLFQFGDTDFLASTSIRVQASRDPLQSWYYLYYSRRIGINDQDQIPLFGGTKFTGKIGRNAVGFMNIQTEETTLSDETHVPATNYSALRYKRDLFRNSNIGFMALNKQGRHNEYNRAFGIDGNFPLSSRLTFGGTAAKTITPDISGKDYAVTGFVNWRTANFNLTSKYMMLEDNFNPAMGYVQRPGIRLYYTRESYSFWINRFGLRSLYISSSFYYITDNEHELVSRRITALNFTTLSNGDRLRFMVFKHFESLDDDDDIRNIVIPAGVYKYNTYTFGYDRDSIHLIAPGIEYVYTDFFRGQRKTFSPDLTVKMSSHFNFRIGYTYNHVELPNGSFYSNVMSGRFIYMFNPSVYIKAFVQWNDLDDRLSANVLFHLIQNETNNFYLVYNENRNPALRDFPVRDRLLMAKFEYHFFR